MGTPGRPGSAPIPLHRPADVARMLQCSEWWVKEQARKRRIPFAWIGGSYRFTDEHVAEVIRLFEQRPDTDGDVPGSSSRVGSARKRPLLPSETPVSLRARVPRRARKSIQIAS